MSTAPEFNMRLLALDVALEFTGWAAYRVSLPTGNHQLADVGLIKTETGDDVDARVRRMLKEVSDLWHKHETNCTIIEKPAMAIYGGRKMGVNYILGRAKSVTMVNSAAFSIVGMCFGNGMYHRVVEPSQWQPHFTEKGKSKSWSLKQANNIINYLKFKHAKLKLTTKEDANIADAINIGSATIINYARKVWIPPEL